MMMTTSTSEREDAKAVGAVQLFWLLTRTTAAWTAKF
jgi:hypothetical protein